MSDAEIIALADNIIANSNQIAQLNDLKDAARNPKETAALWRDIDRLVQDEREMRAALAKTPAQTLAACQAKARVVQRLSMPAYWGSDTGFYDDDAVAFSLANDLVALH